jgi:GTPase SAR1 family protein
MADYEQCESNFADLVAWYGAHAGSRNEATTRLHLIDRLIFDCLGWSRDQVIAEDRLAGQYADYTFVFPRRMLIVEAKREGISFEFPLGQDRLEYSIPSMFRASASLKSAMEQVGTYCHNRGVPFAAVTNGHQLVVFIAVRGDGQSPYEGTCLVYPSLDFMKSHFVALWNTLSKPAVENQTIREKLMGGARPHLPPKLSARVSGYPGIKARNASQASLQDVSDLILEDLVSAKELEPTFIDDCYCESGALSQHSQISRSILRARYSALFDQQNPGPAIISATDKHGTSPELLAESLARRPILLIGDVGVGKTTFIRHLLHVESENLNRTAIPLYLDLGRKGTLTPDLKLFILDDMERQLLDRFGFDIQSDTHVRAVYQAELKRFERSIHGKLKDSKPKVYQEKELDYLAGFLKNREEHLRLSLDYLSHKTRRQVIVFLDNTDQRNEGDQEDAFLIAQEISERWPAIVFLPLRPETFHSSRKRGAITGYHTRAFTVAPPRIDRVLQKRLAFGLRICRGDIPVSRLAGITVRVETLATLIECFTYSMDKNPDLIACVDNVAGGNVRLALELVRSFFGSGHVDTEKIVGKFRYDDYVIPLHEFLRAVIYGDTARYDPSRSPIANLFDVSNADPKEHCLLPMILGYLHSPGPDAEEDGFIAARSVYEKFQMVGFTPEQVDFALIRAHDKKLIETGAKRTLDAGSIEPNSVRITSAGAYHIMTLIYQFAYLDAVVVDTPIFDHATSRHLVDCEDIKDRLERAEHFRQYLDRAWDDSPDVPGVFDWGLVSSELQKMISRIGESIARRKARFVLP